MEKNAKKLAGVMILPIDAFRLKKKKEKAAKRARKSKVDKEDDLRTNPGFDASGSDSDKDLGIDMEIA